MCGCCCDCFCCKNKDDMGTVYPKPNPSPNPDGETPGGDDNSKDREERDIPQDDDVGKIGSGGGTKRIRRLWCQTGFDLAVFPNGKVRGTKSPRNKYALLEFEAAGLDGQIRIKAVSTGFYVTMTPKGRVHGQPLANNRGTIWVETSLGSGTTYHSLLSLDYAHHGYYLALKKSGKPKRGPKTTNPFPQKAISFLARVVAEE